MPLEIIKQEKFLFFLACFIEAKLTEKKGCYNELIIDTITVEHNNR